MCVFLLPRVGEKRRITQRPLQQMEAALEEFIEFSLFLQLFRVENVKFVDAMNGVIYL